MEIQKIISKLLKFDRTFPKEALEAAIERKEEIIPELLKILGFTLENADDLVETDYWGHFYAVYLLAQFREEKAYPLIVDIVSLEGELPFNLFEDVVTEGLNQILASVCAGDITLIKNLIEDRNINEYVRSAALRSLVVLLKNGLITRNEIIHYYKELFHNKLEKEVSFAWENLISCCNMIYPEELMDEIRIAYENGFVDRSYISLENIENTLTQGKDITQKKLQENSHFDLITDTIKELEWWACFEGNEQLHDDMANSLLDAATEYIPQEEVDQFRKRQETHYSNPTPGEPVRTKPKIGRNEPCPCGSGKKYKKCCGEKS
jgi:uncharacterized protein YchJ